jgi:general secretion pathway protein B
MSLILEALRRSEAERRRGLAPGLLDPDPLPRPSPRPAWPMVLAGLLGGLVIAALLAWWVRPWPTAPAAQAALPPPASMPPDRTAEAGPGPVAVETRPMNPRPVAPVAPATPPAARAAAVTTQARGAPSTAGPAPPIAAGSVAGPEPAPEALPSTPRDAMPMPAADPHRGPASGDVAVGELAPSMRAALPPLRLSMHVFSDAPAQRFTIIDGVRYREGESVQPGLQVVAIQRDGVRLDWQGRPLWLPR